MSSDLLDIVNDNDEIIGEATRAEIHARGLLHREIHVWFYTEAGEIIFQHRAKDKDNFPDLLDATVGGHVEKGDSYETAAVREVKEETGLDILVTDLHPLKKVKMRVEDPVTGIINNAFMNQYAYLFTGAKDDLRIEAGKNIGFEFWSIEKLLNATDEDKKKFIPRIFSEEYRQFFITIQEMLIKK